MNNIVRLGKYDVDENILYGHSSFFIDSFKTDVEKIILPPTSSPEGVIKFSYQLNTSNPASSSRRYKIKKIAGLLGISNPVIELDSAFIDLRVNSPSNLSHALMIHMPIVILAEQFLKQVDPLQQLTIILPKNIPSYIYKLFDCQEYKIILTDESIKGKQCLFDISSWTCLRGTLPKILNSSSRIEKLKSEISKANINLPRKIFISRKDSRRLTNESEVETFLVKADYHKIYLEDYGIFQQLAMVVYADSIVAIHGAALGPLVLKSLFPHKVFTMVEIFSPSHVTNVYRILTHQLQGKWVGIRGKIWKELLDSAYSQKSGSIRKYSLENFEACVPSLESALAYVGD